MKSLRPIFAVALLACLVPVFAAAAETERIHKVVPLAAGGTLSLHNFSGQVRIVGADVSEVTIDAVRTASRDRLDHIKLDIQVTGSTVTIQANKKEENWHSEKDNVVQTEFDIQVPRNALLKLDVFSSDVHVRNVSGEQSIKTFSGDLPLTLNEQKRGRLRADLNGGDPNRKLRLKTFSGDVKIGR